MKKTEFMQGSKDGFPIALGYFAVSFSLGIMVVSKGMNIFQGALMSLTNVTSAGEFAGLQIIAAAGTLTEMILTQFIINLRYALMSLSLSQKLDKSIHLWQRFVIAFANTDEIFAVAMNHQKSLTFPYMLGLQIFPVIGWTAGTMLGGIASNLMPSSISIAMNVMLYGMFIAIVIPVAKTKKSVLLVACLAVALSCLFTYVTFLDFVPDGIVIILCTVISAVVGSILYPIDVEEEEA